MEACYSRLRSRPSARASGRRRLLLVCAGFGLLACDGDPADPGADADAAFVQITGDSSVALGDTLRLHAEVRDAHNEVLASAPISWVSLSPEVLIADSTGLLVTADSGTARVYARSGNVADTVRIHVRQVVASLSLTLSTDSVVWRDSLIAAAEARDALGRVMPVAVEWMSGDSLVLKVEAPGIVRTVGAGQTEVIARVDTASASAGVLVTLPVEAEAAGLRFASVSVGHRHKCALTEAGAAYCWGEGSRGALGSGDGSFGMVRVAGGHSFTRVEAGQYESCGHEVSGQMYCWGFNGAGTIGTGSFSPSIIYEPTLAGGGRIMKYISLGDHEAACGVSTAGIAYCWGHNDEYQTARWSLNRSNIAEVDAVAGDIAFARLELGSFHGCGLDPAGAAYCWGPDRSGALGGAPIDTFRTYIPQRVQGGITFSQVYAGGTEGNQVSCGLTPAGRAYCWGANSSGELGRGTIDGDAHRVPEPVAGDRSFTMLSIGGATICGLTSAGELFCWGSNLPPGDRRGGRLGTTAIASAPAPIRVSAQLFRDVSVGFFSTCALDTTGVTYCW